MYTYKLIHLQIRLFLSLYIRKKFIDGLKIKDLSGEEEAAAFFLLADMTVE